MYNASPDHVTLFCIGIASALFLFLMIYYYSSYEYKIIKAL